MLGADPATPARIAHATKLQFSDSRDKVGEILQHAIKFCKGRKERTTSEKWPNRVRNQPDEAKFYEIKIKKFLIVQIFDGESVNGSMWPRVGGS